MKTKSTLLALFFVAAAGSLCDAQERAPEIAVDDFLDNKPFRLADLRGRVVVLEFWSTW